MESMFENLVQSFTVNNSGIQVENVIAALKINQQIGIQKDATVNDLVSYVHQCLNASKTRSEGLLILHVVVDQCSTSVFKEHAVTWMKLLVKILQGYSNPAVYTSTCKVLSLIISHSKTFADVSREIIGSVIPDLFPMLIAASEECRKAALQCVNICIQTFPGPVGPFKPKLESLIYSEIDYGKDYPEMYECFALLAQCGPGGSLGIKHTEAWSELCGSLCNALHDTLNTLYGDLGEQVSVSGRPFSLSQIDYSSADRVSQLVQRWTVLTQCMGKLLSVEFPATAKVPAGEIIQLVCRCLAVNVPTLLSRPTSERCMLAGFIQELHTKGLDMLQQLMLLCRGGLAIHGSLVVGVLAQELTWTHTTNIGHEQTFSYTRRKVYEVLVTWMKTMDGYTGLGEGEVTLNIIKEILHDCLPYVDTLQYCHLVCYCLHQQLRSDSLGSSSNKGAKKKKGGYHEMISHGMSSQRKVHIQANSRLVEGALNALHWLLTVAGSSLSRKSIQDIHEFTIRTLLQTQQSSTTPVPYSSPQCRVGLYRLLQSCVLTPHPTAPSPLQCALGLLAEGFRDRSIEVSSLCIQSMRMCETLIHPRVPCLNGPIVCEGVVRIGAINSKQPVNNAGDDGLSVLDEMDVDCGNKISGSESNGKANRSLNGGLNSDNVGLVGASPKQQEKSENRPNMPAGKRKHAVDVEVVTEKIAKRTDDVETIDDDDDDVIEIDDENDDGANAEMDDVAADGDNGDVEIVIQTLKTTPPTTMENTPNVNNVAKNTDKNRDNNTAKSTETTDHTFKLPLTTVAKTATRVTLVEQQQPGTSNNSKAEFIATKIDLDTEEEETDMNDSEDDMPAVKNSQPASEEKAPDQDITNMIATFVDAGPDSD